MKDQTTTLENLAVEPSELKRWIEKQDEVMILDIRPEDERAEWAIPESVHANVYDAIKSGDPDPFAGFDLPENTPVVTVCGSGKTSLTAAEILRNQGIQAWSLSGGMKAWNFVWSTAEIPQDGDTTIIQVRRPAKGCLSYIIGSGDEAAVIDASVDPQAYTELAEQHGWTIKYVMETHIHADYVSRSRELAQETGAEFLLFRDADTAYHFTPLEDGQQWPVGDSTITVLHTPGHTPESTSFLLNDEAVFTGDTLFTDGIGRPDLKANKQQALKKADQLYNSLHRLLELDHLIRVLPAHHGGSMPFNDPAVSGTIGGLKKRLRFLSLPKDEFLREATDHIPPTPANFETISSINKQGVLGGHDPKDLEAGANRCAVN